MASVYDGLVSRHVNRRFSRPIARALSHTAVTPNQISLLSLAVAGLAFAMFASGQPVAGGLLAQASSIIDGVDGDLARLTGKASPFGAFLDAVIDRYADGFVMLSLTLWAAMLYDGALVWVIGFGDLHAGEDR